MHQRLSRTPLTIGAVGGAQPPASLLAAAVLSERTADTHAYAAPAAPGAVMPVPPAATLTGTPIPGTAPPPPRHYPVEDFFRQAERGYYRLSDDGAHIAFMRPVSVDGKPPRMNVFVQQIDGATLVGEPRRLTAESARDISTFVWKGSGVILYTKDFGGDENFQVVAADIQSAKSTDITAAGTVRATIADPLPEDPDHILVTHNQRSPGLFDVYRVNVRTGASVMVAENPGNVVGWKTDHAGKVRIAVASDGLDTQNLYRDTEAAGFTPLITTDYRTTVTPSLFTFDNKALYAMSNRGRDMQALVRIDPRHPDEEEVIFDPKVADVASVAYSRLRKLLTAVTYDTSKRQRVHFDARMKAIHEKVAAKLPGYEIAFQSQSRNEDKFIVAATTDRTPGARYLYEVGSGSLTKLVDINPALRPDDMAPMQPISFQARDGLTIHGYLTLPKGRGRRNLPCIVNPHGGPWARDKWGYTAEVQFLANRGFAVLQLNFRGSTGYGRKFWEAGFGQWGLAMQDDITDGVKWLIAQGIADPKRIGIYGGSYGGYAALAGAAFTPDLYAAAVDYVGVSNLFTFMQSVPPYWKPLLPKMHDMVGDPVQDRQRLAATSPALHAERIKAPLFIAQGARDPRVNKAESDQMVHALRQRGVDVQYMVKDNEGHGFRNAENRFEFYTAMEGFFRKHLKP